MNTDFKSRCDLKLLLFQQNNNELTVPNKPFEKGLFNLVTQFIET